MEKNARRDSKNGKNRKNVLADLWEESGLRVRGDGKSGCPARAAAEWEMGRQCLWEELRDSRLGKLRRGIVVRGGILAALDAHEVQLLKGLAL